LKKYTFTATQEGEGMTIESTNEGFKAIELLGIFSFKTEDIHKQMRGEIKPDIVTRTVVKEQEVEE